MQLALNILTILAFIISLYNFINDLIERRVKIDIQLIAFDKLSDETQCNTYFKFINQSELPISITSLTLEQHGNTVDCTHIPELVFENVQKNNETITDTFPQRSVKVPIDVSSLGTVSGYIVFRELGKNVSWLKANEPITIHFSTNRRKIITKTFSLPVLSLWQLNGINKTIGD